MAPLIVSEEDEKSLQVTSSSLQSYYHLHKGKEIVLFYMMNGQVLGLLDHGEAVILKKSFFAIDIRSMRLLGLLLFGHHWRNPQTELPKS